MPQKRVVFGGDLLLAPKFQNSCWGALCNVKERWRMIQFKEAPLAEGSLQPSQFALGGYTTALAATQLDSNNTSEPIVVDRGGS